MTTLSEKIKNRPVIGWLLFAAALVIVFVLGLLAASITERRAEVATLFANKKVDITGIESRSEIWGENFPREYNTWKKTVDMDFTSKHMGSNVVDVLEERPEMVILWAGYAFAKDYKAPRGHAHAVEDNVASLRTGTPVNETDGPQPATCWACKSPDVPRMIDALGAEDFYKTKWGALGAEIVNSVGCADCHDPQTMNLTITRPALIEAFQRQGKDVKEFSIEEMRSLVCAQCHVEYYFKGDGKYLTFPWDNGFTMEAMEQYYDSVQFTDWVHKLNKAPMLKAQHPDYELFMMGPHAKRGLSCADCHMPYKADGGIKYSDHQVVSPLKNIAATCQTCHRESEAKLRQFVYEYQDKALEIRNRIEQELSKTHIMAKSAWDNGATEPEMKQALQLIRQAQWRWDFSVASHGGSFHAPVENQRILAHSLDKTMQAQLELQKILFVHGVTDVEMPDISTKEKAQKYIGLDIPKEQAAKDEWLKTVVPVWLKKAKENKRLISQNS
jgi:nitrite reductase (cytochrome c-552)